MFTSVEHMEIPSEAKKKKFYDVYTINFLSVYVLFVFEVIQ